MLPPRVLQRLCAQEVEIFGNETSRVGWVNDVVHKSALRGNKRIRELVGVFQGVLFHIFPAENDFDSALRAHDSNFSTWPREVDISTKVFAGHDVVSLWA